MFTFAFFVFFCFVFFRVGHAVNKVYGKYIHAFTHTYLYSTNGVADETGIQQTASLWLDIILIPSHWPSSILIFMWILSFIFFTICKENILRLFADKNNVEHFTILITDDPYKSQIFSLLMFLNCSLILSAVDPYICVVTLFQTPLVFILPLK